MDDLVGKIEFQPMPVDMSKGELLRTISELLARINKKSDIVACACGRLKNGDSWTDLYLEKGYEKKKTQVSHGICPDCVRELYPDMADELLREK